MGISIKSITLPAVVGLLNKLLYFFKELLFVLLITLIAIVIVDIIIKLIRLIRHLREPFLLLEITPPVDTKIQAVSNTQLFNLIMGLLE